MAVDPRKLKYYAGGWKASTTATYMECFNPSTGDLQLNWAGIKADIGYLQLARELTRDAGIVLFFDEIQSSFKKSPGGAQEDDGALVVGRRRRQGSQGGRRRRRSDRRDGEYRGDQRDQGTDAAPEGRDR